jgi:Family of unknown function (DUF6172)
MRKTYPLRPEGKHPDRVLDAVKHDIRKYQKRERRVPLPAGVDFWDFDCRFGPSKEAAETLHPGALMAALDALAQAGGDTAYVELLAKPGHRKARAADASASGPDEEPQA